MKKSTIGMAPGTLVYDGKASKTEIRLFSYTTKASSSHKIEDLEQLEKELSGKKLFWIQVSGLKDIKLLQALGEMFKIDPLILEDILNQNQRPKFQHSEDGDFITLKKYIPREGKKMEFQQVSLIVGKKYVITFCDTQESIFKTLEERFAKRRKRLTKHGVLYLMYSVLDFIVDQYFPLHEYFEDVLEKLSHLVARTNTSRVREELYSVRKQLLFFRKATLPLLEVTDRLQKYHGYITGKQSIKIYLEDLHDHSVQNQEMIKNYSEILEGLTSLYFSTTSDRTNEVMRALTAITIIFLPLTLIVGLYGMNFHYMPELAQPWGYPAVIIFMGCLAVAITILLKKKNWL